MRMILTVVILLGSFFGMKAQNAQQIKGNDQKGIASFYHPKFEGRKTATGEVFANTKYTAASNHVKLGSYIKVTNLRNGKVVFVKVNDRMAPNNKRLMDLTSAAAEQLNFKDEGTTQVRFEIVSEVDGRNGVLAQREVGSVRNNKL